jgi:hypothetical protein
LLAATGVDARSAVHVFALAEDLGEALSHVSLMYLLCISTVSCVYPARLGRSVQDTCIVMYPDCILLIVS